MSGAAVRKALDRQGGVTLAPALPPMRPVVQPRLRPMSIRAALEWAFGVEHAELDLDNRPEWHVGTDTIWRLMRNGALGCRVDGGGRSMPATDAEIIASFVAALPVALGGKGMAAQIAALARAGLAPDWMPGARPRCVPVGWRNTRHGAFAEVELVGEDVTLHRGRRVRHPVYACPVTYAPTAVQIAAARRGWLQWWAALHHLACDLRSAGLETVRITDAMPPHAPWSVGSGAATDGGD